MGIWDGLKLVLDHRSKKVVLVMSFLKRMIKLVGKIKYLINWEWDVKIKHAYREGNRVTDVAANLLLGSHDFLGSSMGMLSMIFWKIQQSFCGCLAILFRIKK